MRLEPCLMLANSDGTVSYFDEYKTGRADCTSALELFEKSQAFLLTSATRRHGRLRRPRGLGLQPSWAQFTKMATN